MLHPARHTRTVGAVILAAASVGSASFADAIDTTWLGGTGLWNDPTRWSGGVVPNNSASTTFRAFIPDGSVTASGGTLSVDAFRVSAGATMTLSTGFRVAESHVDGRVFVRTISLITGPMTGDGTVTVGIVPDLARLGGTTVLDIGAALTVPISRYSGVGSTAVPFINRGHLYGGDFDLTLAPFISGSSIQNLGTIEARGGTMLLRSPSFSRADLGNLMWSSNGTFIISGTFLNQGQTLDSDASHAWGMRDGAIRGGSINVAAGSEFPVGRVDANTTVIFDDVAVNGPIALYSGSLVLTNGFIGGTAQYNLGLGFGVQTRLVTTDAVLTIGPNASVCARPGDGGTLGDGTNPIINHGSLGPASDPYGFTFPLSLLSSGPVLSDGTISLFGAGGGVTVGTTVNPQNLIIASGGVLSVGVKDLGELMPLLDVSGQLDLRATGDQLMLTPIFIQHPGSFVRIAKTGGILGQFDSVTPGYEVEYRNGTEIWARFVPEPGSAIAFLAATFAVRRPRRLALR